MTLPLSTSACCAASVTHYLHDVVDLSPTLLCTFQPAPTTSAAAQICPHDRVTFAGYSYSKQYIHRLFGFYNHVALFLQLRLGNLLLQAFKGSLQPDWEFNLFLAFILDDVATSVVYKSLECLRKNKQKKLPERYHIWMKLVNAAVLSCHAS